MIDLKGKKALVTGATGGIGSATTKLLHELGAHVYISGTNQEKLEKLGADLGGNYTIKTCDLSDISACESLLNNIEKLDILVCNAGITRDTLAIKMKNSDFSDVIDINLKANFILNREAAKKMMRSRCGRIINISSVVAITGNPGQANYSASKSGLIGMTKSIAHEVATRGVTVNAIAPGFIKSNMTDKLNDAHKEYIINKIPSKKLGLPKDVASAVAYLASDGASYITGQTLHVNGGMLMV